MARTRGFTLIELLSVIGVIGILAALAMPAVQQAREAARQTTCRNNLKQLGLALHLYHDLHNCFPTGMLQFGTADTNYWMQFILPQLDQGPLYALINPTGRTGIREEHFRRHGTILPGGSTVLSVFRCPSSQLPSHTANLGPAVMPEWLQGYAVSDYKGNRGGRRDHGLFWDGGILAGKPPIRFSDITDGASTTVAIAESPLPDCTGEFWPSWLGSIENMVVLFNTHDRINCARPLVGRYWMNAGCNSCAQSFHAGMAQFVFADGTVRSLSEKIDRDVYNYLGDRDDGHPVSLDF